MCFNKYKYKRIWCENIERLTLVYRIIIDWSLQTNCIDVLISSLLNWRKVSCVGFIIWFPSGGFSRRCYATPQNDIKCVARHKLHFWPNNRRTRQLFVFCLFIPFPHGYKVSRGIPVFLLAMTGHPGVSRTARRFPCMNFGKC